MNTQILTVSSKVQISLPISICKLLSINTGDKLIAYTSGDVIMLKTLKLPSAEEFEASLDEAQKWAMSVGYNENDVNDIIKSVRRKKGSMVMYIPKYRKSPCRNPINISFHKGMLQIFFFTILSLHLYWFSLNFLRRCFFKFLFSYNELC